MKVVFPRVPYWASCFLISLQTIFFNGRVNRARSYKRGRDQNSPKQGDVFIACTTLLPAYRQSCTSALPTLTDSVSLAEEMYDSSSSYRIETAGRRVMIDGSCFLS